MSIATEEAKVKFDKAENRLNKVITVFLVYIVILTSAAFGGVMYQTAVIQHNQAVNTAASAARFKKYQQYNADQHKKTQAYVKCIAQVLLKPIEDRTPAMFDNCTPKN